MNKFLLLNLLKQGGFLMLNKILIKELGLDEAAVLAMLLDKNAQHGDEFFVTADSAQETLNIGRRPYDSAIATLKEKGLITTHIKGIPPKTYFVINFDTLSNYFQFVQNVQLDLYGVDNSICTKRTTNNNKDNNIPPNSNKLLSSPKGASKRFIKPTIEDIAAYCATRNNGINAEDFFYYYESKGWAIGRSPMKDWKAAIRTWEIKRNQEQKQEEVHVYE